MKLDAQLRALAAGDLTRFDEIYAATDKAVYFTALAIVKDRALAEDVMQSTYLTVIQKASSYRPGTNAAAWIATIARNTALNVYGRRRREESVDPGEREAEFGAAEDEDRSLIELARKLLSEEEFMLVVLIAVHRYKRREVAEYMDMPVPTVTWKYRRALGTLKESLQRAERRTQ